ncbi:MAG: hypothetical protein KVP17_002078 [Porospora cf. gigantea B]|nr:MAG: hypothetical protein KVP17_002078 [Porospora cf. gigantea B]
MIGQPQFLWTTAWDLPLRQSYARACHPRQSWDVLCRRWMAELRTLPVLYRTHGVAGLQEALDLAYIEVSRQRTSHRDTMIFHAYKKLLNDAKGLVQAVLSAYLGIFRLTSAHDDMLPMETVVAWGRLVKLAREDIRNLKDGTCHMVEQGLDAALTGLSHGDLQDDCAQFGSLASRVWSPPLCPKISVEGNESLTRLERLGESIRSRFMSKVAEKLIMTVRENDRRILTQISGKEDVFHQLWGLSRLRLIPGELQEIRPEHAASTSSQSCTRRFSSWNRPRDLINEVRLLPVRERTLIGRLLLKTVLLQLHTIHSIVIVEGIIFYYLRHRSSSHKEALGMSFSLWSDAIVSTCCADENQASYSEVPGCLGILDMIHTFGKAAAVNNFTLTNLDEVTDLAISALQAALTEGLNLLDLVNELPWASRVRKDWRDLTKYLSQLQKQPNSGFPKEVRAYTSLNQRLVSHEKQCEDCNFETHCPTFRSLIDAATKELPIIFSAYQKRRQIIKAKEHWTLHPTENPEDLQQPRIPSCDEQPIPSSALEKGPTLFKWHGSGLRPQPTASQSACTTAELNIGTLVIQFNP